MRNLVLAAAMSGMFCASSALANAKLLDCNLPSVPDQEVVVERNSNGLVLRELSTSGSWDERELSISEWQSRQLKLSGEGALLVADQGGWFYEILSGGTRIQGEADCF